ncbi:hypothetical protein WJX82_011284 [Trebouxia sp. C0006]
MARNTSQSIADLIADALDSATYVPYSLAFQLLSLLCDLYSRTHVRAQSEPGAGQALALETSVTMPLRHFLFMFVVSD